MACAQVFWRKPPNGKFIAGIRTPVPLSLSQPKPSQPAHKAWHWIWDHKLSWYSDIFNSCTSLGIIFSPQPKSVWGRSTPVACLVSSQYPSVNPKSLQQALLLLLMKRMTINASLELIITNRVLSLCHILLPASKKGKTPSTKYPDGVTRKDLVKAIEAKIPEEGEVPSFSLLQPSHTGPDCKSEPASSSC